MDVYINTNGFYDTDDPCPKCGWIVDIVDYDDDSYECYCSQCKKRWSEKIIPSMVND